MIVLVSIDGTIHAGTTAKRSIWCNRAKRIRSKVGQPGEIRDVTCSTCFQFGDLAEISADRIRRIWGIETCVTHDPGEDGRCRVCTFQTKTESPDPLAMAEGLARREAVIVQAGKDNQAAAARFLARAVEMEAEVSSMGNWNSIEFIIGYRSRAMDTSASNPYEYYSHSWQSWEQGFDLAAKDIGE